MNKPTHFDVTYSINPWMKPQSESIKKDLALEQWHQLYSLIAKHAQIEHIPTPSLQLPDFVFTANAGLIYKKEIILSSFVHRERTKEEQYWKTWFSQHGFTTHTIETNFEGAGDALFMDNTTLLGGYGIRTKKEAYIQIKKIWPHITILPLRLVDPYFYHLDTCLCALDHNTIFYYPPAFSVASQTLLLSKFTCIPVSKKEAYQFACNAIVIKNNIILPEQTPIIEQQLIARGYTTNRVPMSEFSKAGGAAKCLTLLLSSS